MQTLKTATAQPQARTIDIWLIFVIVVLVLSIGGGLWITGKSIVASLDELSIRTTNRLGRLETELFELRKQGQDIEFAVNRLAKQNQAAARIPSAPPSPPARPSPSAPSAAKAPPAGAR
jgi:hypothetical protein